MNFRTLLLSTILVHAFGAYAQTSGNKTTFNPLRLKATATYTISSGTKDDSMAYFYSGIRAYDKILDIWQFDSVKRYGYDDPQVIFSDDPVKVCSESFGSRGSIDKKYRTRR